MWVNRATRIRIGVHGPAGAVNTEKKKRKKEQHGAAISAGSVLEGHPQPPRITWEMAGPRKDPAHLRVKALVRKQRDRRGRRRQRRRPALCDREGRPSERGTVEVVEAEAEAEEKREPRERKR